jgi:hypothetical protein
LSWSPKCAIFWTTLLSSTVKTNSSVIDVNGNQMDLEHSKRMGITVRSVRTRYKIERLYIIIPFYVGLHSKKMSVKKIRLFGKFTKYWGYLYSIHILKCMAFTKLILLNKFYFVAMEIFYILPFHVGAYIPNDWQPQN